MEAGSLEVLALALSVYLVNVPLGYWRASAKARGRRWEVLAAIHAAVPYAALARREAGLGYLGLVIFVSLYFLGQATGGLLFQARERAGGRTS